VLLYVLSPGGRRRILETPEAPTNPVGYRVLFRNSKGEGVTGLVYSFGKGKAEGKAESFPDKLPLILAHHFSVAKELALYYGEPFGKVVWDFIPSVFDWYEEEFILAKVKQPETLDPKTREVVSYVKKRGRVTYESLKKKFPYDLIKILLDRHILVKEKKWIAPKEDTKFFSLNLPLQEALKRVRSERKKELLEFINEYGVVSSEEIKREGFSLSALKDLIKKGLIKEVYEEKVDRAVSLSPEGKVLRVKGKRVVVAGSFNFVLSRLISITTDKLGKGEDVLIICTSGKELEILTEILRKKFGKSLIPLGLKRGKELYKAWFEAHEGRKVVIGRFKASFSPLPKLGAVILFNDYQNTKYPRNGMDIRRLLYLLANNTGAEFFIMSPFYTAETLLAVRSGLFAVEEEEIKVPVRVIERRGEVITQETFRFLRDISSERILFLVTKKGYGYLYCTRCDSLAECPDCGTFLTYSKETGSVFCVKRKSHYLTKEKRCPKCGGFLEETGVGIEKAKEVLESLFGKKDNFIFSTSIPWYESFDYVVILNGDAVLSVPGYRSYEEFIKMVATATRVARKEVILQTNVVGDDLKKLLSQGKLKDLLLRELEKRRENRLPPFYRLAVVESRERLTDLLSEQITEDFFEVKNENGTYKYLIRFKRKEVLQKLKGLKGKEVRITLE